jgi:hypothetical protein
MSDCPAITGSTTAQRGFDYAYVFSYRAWRFS